MVKSVSIRFVKAFLAGAAATLTVASVQNAHSWADLNTALANVAFAAIIGGISGVVLAFEKWATWQD